MLKKTLILLILISPILAYSQGLFVVRNPEGKYGFADKNGDTLIECKYDYAEEFSGGLALVKSNPKYRIIDTTGMLYPIEAYDGTPKFRHDMGELHSGLPVIVKEWDCEYISSSGETFIKIPYQDAQSFENGKAKIFDGDRYNYIAKNGLLLGSWIIEEDNYHAMKSNDKYGFIDKNGRLVIDYQYTDAKDFKDGYALIGNGTYWAIIGKNGERISDWYENISPFEGELAVVKKLGNTGFINRQGRFVGKWYEKVEPLDYGLYKVKKYEQYAIVNNEGFLVTQWFDRIETFYNGYVRVEKEGKFAYINKIGAMAIGWFDNISNIKDGITRIEDNGLFGFFNVEDFFISEFYEYLGEFYDGIALIKKNGKYGFISKKGVIISNIEYEKATPFDGGIAQVEKDGKAAYINTSGEIVMGWLESKTYFYKEPPRGLIAVKMGRKYGFQTINGKRVIAAQFDYAENFYDGLALVKNNPHEMFIGKDGKLKPLTENPDENTLRLDLGYGHTGDPVKITAWECSFIDYNGDIVLKLDYNDAFSFSNGKAMVIDGDKYNFIDLKGKLVGKWKEFPDDYHADFKNGKYGFLDKNGNLAIPYKFNSADDFIDGKAKVRIGDRNTGKYGFINRKGEFFTKMYSQVSDFENGISIVENDGKQAVIDTSGKEISKWYDNISNFYENYARVKTGEKYSFISKFGDQFNLWFDDAGDFSGGRAKIKIGEKWGFVGKNGEIAVRADYDNVWNFENNIAKVELNGKNAFIDLNGKMITDWFDRIFMFSDERAVICKDNKWGYIDITGRIVIKPSYDRAFAFTNGEAIVVSNGKMVKIDKFGNYITEQN
ncbi:MAG: WG repeat-containing protein [Bacteroidales bacterium]|nr:WG repeat-containing protein [Bacteroidales bacterium]